MSTIFKIGGLAPYLAGVLVLSGCMTSKTAQSIKYPVSKPVHDFVDKVERAWITASNDLHILVEARLTNSPQRAQYTMVVTLGKIDVGPTPISPYYTNRPVLGSYELKRGGILPGWSMSEGARGTLVPIGPPVGYNEIELVKSCRVLPGTERTLFPVIERISDGPLEQIPYKFIYADTTRPELFTEIRVEEVRTVPEVTNKYWVLPFAVLGDIATSPVQVLYFAVYYASGGH